MTISEAIMACSAFKMVLKRKAWKDRWDGINVSVLPGGSKDLPLFFQAGDGPISVFIPSCEDMVAGDWFVTDSHQTKGTR